MAILHKKTRSVPIVFAQIGDPVGLGFVASLARPGGNFTGFGNFEVALSAKWLELLKQVAPSVTRVAVLYDPANPKSFAMTSIIEAAARSHNVQVFPAAVRDAGEIERTLDAFGREPNGGLIPIPGPLLVTNGGPCHFGRDTAPAAERLCVPVLPRQRRSRILRCG